MRPVREGKDRSHEQDPAAERLGEQAFVAVAHPSEHVAERYHVETVAERIVDPARGRLDAEHARDLPDERRDRFPPVAQPLVERAHDAVRIGPPQRESGTLLSCGDQEDRMDRAGTSAFVDRQRQHDVADLPHAQDAVDERGVEVHRDRRVASVGKHEVEADDPCAPSRCGCQQIAEMAVPQRHRLG